MYRDGLVSQRLQVIGYTCGLLIREEFVKDIGPIHINAIGSEHLICKCLPIRATFEHFEPAKMDWPVEPPSEVRLKSWTDLGSN